MQTILLLLTLLGADTWKPEVRIDLWKHGSEVRSQQSYKIMEGSYSHDKQTNNGINLTLHYAPSDERRFIRAGTIFELVELTYGSDIKDEALEGRFFDYEANRFKSIDKNQALITVWAPKTSTKIFFVVSPSTDPNGIIRKIDALCIGSLFYTVDQTKTKPIN